VAILAALLVAACGPAGATVQPSVPAPASAGPTGAASASAPAEETLDDLYQAAKNEGGVLSLYSVLPPDFGEVILPEFTKAYPDIEIQRVDLNATEMVARIISESRGGRVIADVAHFNFPDLANLNDQGLVEQWSPPEAADYPEDLRGDWWTAVENQFWVGAWNTDLIPADKEPDSFDDFTDPIWKDQLVGDARDDDMIPILADGKYGGDESKAIGLMEAIAKNNPVFHSGHSELVEFLGAGQAAGCFTCFSHHLPPRIAEGAPIKYFITEGVGVPAGIGVVKGAPHPNTAKLFVRWAVSTAGQQVWANSGRVNAHPDVEPTALVRPDKEYNFLAKHLDAKAADGRTYQEVWQAIFNLR
jgi:iron(III) transport system substrate-binding protein